VTPGQPPPSPKIYHITHVTNLPSIIAAGALWSDRRVQNSRVQTEVVGMSDIKARRMNTLRVSCCPGTFVGDFVPFYFCPRSVMLYLLFRGNHPGLSYTGGQGSIVHLQADLAAVVQWAGANRRPWAFTEANAAAAYTQGRFYSSLNDLHRVNWGAVASSDFRSPSVKEGKQAEFLFRDAFPWGLIERVGVHSVALRTQVQAIVAGSAHQPPVAVEPTWYF
jgi:hypothetical protein